ncbi:purine-cytosine permease [Maudiozyma exigua]|uniref:Purine-cytosine permease n=1 Tax=Maudiozyma exigua TaxID=34358 RepID=A0A9P6W081_MAUEX|nr:purine-cytosine permease [Kazachstania exigua]
MGFTSFMKRDHSVDNSDLEQVIVPSINSEEKNTSTDGSNVDEKIIYRYDTVTADDDLYAIESAIETKLSWFNRLATYLNAETKGIEPVGEDERNPDESVVNASSMWFSANMVIAAYALGGLGPMIYQLNFGTSVLVIIFFNILGLLPVAYFSIFGCELGLRQMVLSRFLLGNLTARIFALINVVACVGWGVVNTVVSAQLLNMVNHTSGHEMPLWAGFIIARLAKSHKFSNGEWTSGPTTAGNVLSFGCAVYGFATGWTTYAADYTVYMPKNTNKYKIFFSLVAGLSFPLFFCMILGAASAMGAVNDPTWNQYYQKNSMGGLTYAILVPDSLHGFGQFCCVLLAMSTVANNVPNMYTIALSAQAMWGSFAKIPRVIWTLAGNAATIAIAIPACYYFEGFMQNFMDSIGYYLAIYTAIALSEHFIYRKNSFNNYNIEDWNDNSKLPIGIAGTAAFIVAAFGVALGMCQTYWVGEISRLIGKFGGDIGFELGASWAFITYNIIRPFEIKYFGR